MIQGQHYTRHDIIKATANKAGGAHADFSLKPKEMHLEPMLLTAPSWLLVTAAGETLSTPDSNLVAIRQMVYEIFHSPELLKLAGSDVSSRFIQWGQEQATIATTREGDDRDFYFAAARELYQLAFEIGQDNYHSLGLMGQTFQLQAAAKQGEEAQDLLKLACTKYEQATHEIGDPYEAFNNWGNALQALADLSPGCEMPLLDRAIEKYQEAIRINPNYYLGHYHWASALGYQATLVSGQEVNVRLNEAIAHCNLAIQIDSNNHLGYYCRGKVYAHQAKILNDDQSDAQYELAYADYAEALRLAPSDQKARQDWRDALRDHANRKCGEQAAELIASAEKLENLGQS